MLIRYEKAKGMNNAQQDRQNQPLQEGAEIDSNHPKPNLSLIERGLLGAIRVYQLTFSPFIGRQCRFYPTCSHYASEAIAQRGALKGVELTLKRLAKCHPFHPGGVDLVPVPQVKNKSSNTFTTHS